MESREIQSVVSELRGVAQEILADPSDYSATQHSEAQAVIAALDRGDWQAALAVGLIY